MKPHNSLPGKRDLNVSQLLDRGDEQLQPPGPTVKSRRSTSTSSRMARLIQPSILKLMSTILFNNKRFPGHEKFSMAVGAVAENLQQSCYLSWRGERIKLAEVMPSKARQPLMRSYWELSKRSRKRLTAALLLVLLSIACVPIPFSFAPPKTGKESATPFPCQNRPCGCRTAEQCKKKCCCFSTEQKLAWAKRNGLNASDVVDGYAICEQPSSTSGKSCCASKQPVTIKVSSAVSKHIKSQTPKKFVVGFVAQKCQGNVQAASGQLVFLIPPVIDPDFQIEPTGERVSCSGCPFTQPLPEPPEPPPRLVAV